MMDVDINIKIIFLPLGLQYSTLDVKGILDIFKLYVWHLQIFLGGILVFSIFIYTMKLHIYSWCWQEDES